MAAPVRSPERRTRIKAPKACTADECRSLEQLPNVGPAMAADLRLLGIPTPQHLKGRDGLQLYRALCAATGQRQDPCVLDTLLAVVDFMHGAPPAPWWTYTARRRAMEAIAPIAAPVAAPVAARPTAAAAAPAAESPIRASVNRPS